VLVSSVLFLALLVLGRTSLQDRHLSSWWDLPVRTLSLRAGGIITTAAGADPLAGLFILPVFTFAGHLLSQPGRPPRRGMMRGVRRLVRLHAFFVVALLIERMSLSSIPTPRRLASTASPRRLGLEACSASTPATRLVGAACLFYLAGQTQQYYSAKSDSASRFHLTGLRFDLIAFCRGRHGCLTGETKHMRFPILYPLIPVHIFASGFFITYHAAT
jgi:hypothetical protein